MRRARAAIGPDMDRPSPSESGDPDATLDPAS
jgi:hypothetical protein